MVKREGFHKWDAIFGALIGIPNYFSSRFLLKALDDVDAVVAYPVYSVGAIILISAAGMLMFKEKLGTRKLIGLIVVIAALVLLNVG